MSADGIGAQAGPLGVRARSFLGAGAYRLGIILIYTFLYLPAAVIALYSFNSGDVMSWPPTGFGLHWYQEVFSDTALMEGLKNSLIVAFVSIAGSLVLGVPAGIALDRFSFPGKVTFQRLLIVPFLLPGVISGVALLTVFLDLGMQLSLVSVIIGHTTMLLAVVVIQMAVALSRWDRSLESAAMDLGANELRTFTNVMWPGLRGAILGAALLGFAVSLDEVARTFFLAGTSNTLPLVVYSALHRTITPKINAIGTLILMLSLIALIVWARSGAAMLGEDRTRRGGEG